MNGGSRNRCCGRRRQSSPEEIFIPAPRMPLTQAPRGHDPSLPEKNSSMQTDIQRHRRGIYLIRAISRRGARGLMQCCRHGNALRSEDIFDPAQNIDAGTQYLRDLSALSGRLVTDIAAIWGGSRATVWPRTSIQETISYVRPLEDVRARKSKNKRKNRSEGGTKAVPNGRTISGPPKRPRIRGRRDGGEVFVVFCLAARNRGYK